MSWHYSLSIPHAPSGHPGGIVDRLRLMQESSLTLCPFFEGAFCPLSREATRDEGALRILWRRGLGIRRRCGSRGRTDSKIRRVWFVNGTAWAKNPSIATCKPRGSPCVKQPRLCMFPAARFRHGEHTKRASTSIPPSWPFFRVPQGLPSYIAWF